MRGRFILILSSCFLSFLSPLLAQNNSEEPRLNLYCWVDYIAPEIIELFEKETGIKIDYTPFDNNEMLTAVLMTGSSSYDVVCPSAWPHIAPQIKAELYQPLDYKQLPNTKDLDRFLMDKLTDVDPGNTFALPFAWGITGFGYNVTQIRQCLPGAPIDSLRMLFDYEVVSKFHNCGISFLDEAVDVIPLALLYLGLDPNSSSLEDLNRVGELLKKIRPHISSIGIYRAASELAKGEMCLVQGWSSEISKIKRLLEEAKDNVRIEFVIPKEGASMWVDVFAIPKTAPHPRNAHRFLDFMMRPEIAAKASNYTAAATAVKTALPFIKAEIKNNQMIFPSAEIREKLFVDAPLPSEFSRARTRLWMQIKANRKP